MKLEYDIERTDHNRIYVGVNDLFDVKIVKTDEGVVVDVYAKHSFDGEPLATCYAFDSEAEEKNK